MAEHVLFAKMAESHHYVNRQLPLIGDGSWRAIRRWKLLLGDGSGTKFRPARIHRDSGADPQKLGFSDFFPDSFKPLQKSATSIREVAKYIHVRPTGVSGWCRCQKRRAGGSPPATNPPTKNRKSNGSAYCRHIWWRDSDRVAPLGSVDQSSWK